MSTTSIRALRRANPRSAAGFSASVESSAEMVRARIASSTPVATPQQAPLRRVARISVAGVALVAVAVAVGSLAITSLGGSPGVENAAAAVKRAANATAASADRSGTATVRIAHGDEVWAASTVRWNGNDLALARDAPRRPGRAGIGGTEMLVVDGMLYGLDPEVEGGWIAIGPPSSIDPDSGTTPAEYLSTVREDVGGATLRRITGGMTGLTTRQLDDGSTVFSGKVAAGLIARETGFKEGQAIRVFPFGYVAHDEAADPAALLDVGLETGPDGLVRSIVVTWGTGASAWSYVVWYSELGTTAAPVAPKNARSLLRERELPKPAQR